MKNHFLTISALCATAAIMLSGCGTGTALPVTTPELSNINITLDQLAQANDIDNILSRHENCYATVEVKDMPYRGFGTYTDKDIFFYEFYDPQPGTWQSTVYFNGGQWFMRYGEDALPILSYNWYIMSDDEKYEKYYKTGRHEFFTDYTATGQYITAFEQSEDKWLKLKDTLIMRTRSDDKYVQEYIDRYRLYNTQYWFAKLDHRYNFDPTTLELEYNKNFLRLQSGKVYTYFYSYLQYDVNQPDFMKMIMAIATETMNNTDTEMKLLTAVYDYGTDSEETFTLPYNGRYSVTPYGRDGYTAYLDPDRTTPFDGNIKYEDMTIYYFR